MAGVTYFWMAGAEPDLAVQEPSVSSPRPRLSHVASLSILALALCLVAPEPVGAKRKKKKGKNKPAA